RGGGTPAGAAREAVAGRIQAARGYPGRRAGRPGSAVRGARPALRRRRLGRLPLRGNPADQPGGEAILPRNRRSRAAAQDRAQGAARRSRGGLELTSAGGAYSARNTLRAAASVCSISDSPWAADTYPASKADGARYTY